MTEYLFLVMNIYLNVKFTSSHFCSWMNFSMIMAEFKIEAGVLLGKKG